MEGDAPPPIPDCSLLEENSGIKFYALKKTLLFSYDPKIRIISIGKENDLGTRNIILMGATGSGKTCLLNALVNHLLEVKFEDNYRYVLKDETGDDHKSQAESQTDYVVGYLIYTPPGSSRAYNYMIIDTPGFKDSRGEQRDSEVTQQIRTFLRDVDGVDELHCIGFVVNGTIARLQDQFKDIVGTFCEVFGENANGIIRVLISFGHMRKPPVLDVLECSCLKSYKRCKFDNVSLNACNKANEEYTEEEIAVSRTFWNTTARVYDSLFSEVESINAVSLAMTRDTLNSIENLHKSLDVMKGEVISYVDLMLDFNQLEDECQGHKNVMTANENWQGTVEIKVRDRVKHLDSATRLAKHAHNCEKCMQTCTFPCRTKFKNKCPKPGMICDHCPCPNENHVKSNDVISHHFEDRPVIHEDKKALYEEAKRQELVISQQMGNLTENKHAQISKIKEIVQMVMEHLEKIKVNSLGNDHNTLENLIEQILMEVKMGNLNQSSSSQEQQKGHHVIPVLEDLKGHLTIH